MHLACDRDASPRELFASVFGMALFSDSFSIGVSYGSFFVAFLPQLLPRLPVLCYLWCFPAVTRIAFAIGLGFNPSLRELEPYASDASCSISYCMHSKDGSEWIHVWPDVYGAHLYDLIYEAGERGFSVGGDDNWFLPFSAVVDFVSKSIRFTSYATLVYSFDRGGCL